MLTQSIQMIAITPDQLQNAILEGVKKQLQELAEQFQPKEATEYLTRSELRDLLKVDLSTLHNWQRKGKLKAYGIGSRVYYKRSEIDALMTPLN